MKRDIELIRKILSRINNKIPLTFDEYDQDLVDFHLDLIKDNDLLKNGILTSKGLEFLNATNSITTFCKVMKITNKNNGLPYEIFELLLKQNKQETIT